MSDMFNIDTRAKAVAKSLSPAQKALLRDLPETGIEAASFWNKDKRLVTYRALARRRLANSTGEISRWGKRVLEEL